MILEKERMGGKLEERPSICDAAFVRLSQCDVIEAVVKLKATIEDMQQLWDSEVSKYEETILIDTGAGKMRLGRRNYPNRNGSIDDVSLFPYHSSCYPLLDCYECLGDYTLSSEDIRPSSLFIDQDEIHDDTTFKGYLPNSLNAILAAMNNLESLEDLSSPSKTRDTFQNRSEILLKLLRHSMSDLQCDHRLAFHVTQTLNQRNCFTDVDIFRKFLSIVLAERKYCNGNCSRFNNTYEEQDHDCQAWAHLAQEIGASMASLGSGYTREHALIIAAAIKFTYDEANPGAGLREDNVARGIQNDSSSQVKMKLKQALYLWKRTDFDEYGSDQDENQVRETIPYHLFGNFIKRLGEKVQEERFDIQEHETTHFLARRSLISRKVDSIQNSIATFVFFGELSIRRLPVNSDSILFCSTLIQAIVTAYVGSKMNPSYLSYRANEQPELPSIIDPNRYSNAIVASRFQHKVSDWQEGCNIRPPTEIFDVIRCLFSRSLIDIVHARCGYGDCLVWLGGEITANDPLLFLHVHNYPIDSEDESVWLVDEGNAPLFGSKLEARYDFTLVKLLQRWHSPWSPKSHHSFQPQFRQAVKTMLLAAVRSCLPNDVVYQIIKFLPRSAWVDERARCWCDDCRVDNALSLMYRHLEGNSYDWLSSSCASMHCKTCQIPMYKNSDHAKKQSGSHRKNCGRPPYRIPGHEESDLCKLVESVFNGNPIVLPEPDEQDIKNDESFGNSDDDWESVYSDDDDDEDTYTLTATNIIHGFFNRKASKNQRTIESAFEAMYIRDE